MMMGKESQVLGVSLGSQTDEDRAVACAYVHAKLKSGVIKLAVGEVYAIAEASKAHVGVIKNKSKGKVVLKCWA